MKSIIRLSVIALFALSLISCSSDDDDTKPPVEPESDCYVQLFDGDNFKDDNITIDGPGEFSTLENLSGANKDWNDEADSFKAGKNTTITFWTKTNFEGDSITFEKGAEVPSVDEPSSMKIKCD